MPLILRVCPNWALSRFGNSARASSKYNMFVNFPFPMTLLVLSYSWHPLPLNSTLPPPIAKRGIESKQLVLSGHATHSAKCV
ncbi:uncharacterized protein LACBIDRAFT_313040 [Laccaria bicolor S238N-H82]|uniref:Predicted protein n=1 Tax=Laccaria bicolor (strain S238N-H82 / ATCC MYA-4686) TaxID=486041 RepID=B0DXE6_LACBS|nr:uncharacterized protein LACBIDRAFT_313040 [Laccaria bicolor S238N-H82]EDR00778.1 predicted protein [Laccaria bicolor S238N-H82]|eukprot:XP_001888570.1 predicted protein [Laccaria bicolor S238N-H82]